MNDESMLLHLARFVVERKDLLEKLQELEIMEKRVEPDGWFTTLIKGSRIGLPSNILVSNQGYATHEPRIRVSLDREKFKPTFSIAIETLEMLDGQPTCFTDSEMKTLFDWVTLNRDLLLEFWQSEDMDSSDLIQGFKDSK